MFKIPCLIQSSGDTAGAQATPPSARDQTAHFGTSVPGGGECTGFNTASTFAGAAGRFGSSSPCGSRHPGPRTGRSCRALTRAPLPARLPGNGAAVGNPLQATASGQPRGCGPRNASSGASPSANRVASDANPKQPALPSKAFNYKGREQVFLPPLALLLPQFFKSGRRLV